MNLTKKNYLSKTSTMISGKKRIVYTGLKGGRFYMKGGKKSYLKKTNKIITKLSNTINLFCCNKFPCIPTHIFNSK